MNTGNFGKHAQYKMGKLPDNTIAPGPGRAATPMPTSQAARDQERQAQLEIWNQATKDPNQKFGAANKPQGGGERRTDNYNSAQGKANTLPETDVGPAPMANFDPLSDSDEDESAVQAPPPAAEPPKPAAKPAEEPAKPPPAAEVPKPPAAEAPKPPAPASEPPKAPAAPAAPEKPKQPEAAAEPPKEKAGCCTVQ